MTLTKQGELNYPLGLTTPRTLVSPNTEEQIISVFISYK